MKNAGEIFRSILSSKKHIHIKLLGDSITHGVGGTGYKQSGEIFALKFARNPDGNCWANKFKAFMGQKYDCTVTNNGCSGTTIQFIINNFDTLVYDRDDIIICAIGTNNRHFKYADGSKPSKEMFAKNFYDNIVKLYQKIKDANKEVIFIANIPASQSEEQDSALSWRILHMDDINLIYKHAAEKLDFPLISMYDLFCEYCEKQNIPLSSLLKDGLHPNNDGHELMFRLLCEQLGIS